MKTNHTPAPWHVAESRSDMPFIINSTGKLTIANSIHGASSDEQGANARLIAAAPELLRTLISLEHGLNDLEEMCRRIVGDIGTANLAREKADWCRTAIAKATGN